MAFRNDVQTPDHDAVPCRGPHCGRSRNTQSPVGFIVRYGFQGHILSSDDCHWIHHILLSHRLRDERRYVGISRAGLHKREGDVLRDLFRCGLSVDDMAARRSVYVYRKPYYRQHKFQTVYSGETCGAYARRHVCQKPDGNGSLHVGLYRECHHGGRHRFADARCRAVLPDAPGAESDPHSLGCLLRRGYRFGNRRIRHGFLQRIRRRFRGRQSRIHALIQ